MTSKWQKAKMALGLNMCLYSPRSNHNEPSSAATAAADVAKHLSESLSFSSVASEHSQTRTPTSSFPGSLLPRSGSKSSKKTCAICLSSMKSGQGQAIFTAECSHSFHFHCITSNVRRGNKICPMCRAKWKEIPIGSPIPDASPNRRFMMDPLAGRAQDDGYMTLLRRTPQPRLGSSRSISSLVHGPEPGCFDDDEVLHDGAAGIGKRTPLSVDNPSGSSSMALNITTHPEVPAVPRAACNDNFTILIHLKAPKTSVLDRSQDRNRSPRAPVDLVTVLDVSGSMGGTKLALLKQAMGFVVQSLGPADRLSVIAFSSTASRLFPLRCMTDSGRQQALEAVNSLISKGGTNIAEGLRKGFKVMLDRKFTNPVASIMLLSDGQDTYSISSTGLGISKRRVDSESLLPDSVLQQNIPAVAKIPVHTFGFGVDHDATSMHSISRISGGTFSFIETENVIQDAFAQCVGGLLSVVIQELKVEIESTVQLRQLKTGSYQSSVDAAGKTGLIVVGDLYAEEERDFLATVKVPVMQSCHDEQPILKVKCVYSDPITRETVRHEEASQVRIQRPQKTGEQAVSLDVDRQRNRLYAAEAMTEARVAAERGDFSSAVSILEACNRALAETASGRARDRLCISLCAELREMRQRMSNRRVYEATGRAYMLSGLSSHSWQRATARGDSTSSNSLLLAYQTPSMEDMVTQSQTMIFGKPPSSPRRRKQLKQALSFPAGPHPR
ncbi:hypothetical protein SAY87_015612 [Trapa incisa]|uniref:Zinc finger (C3HC4-type RING finger) family protein n=1 Tax=Trapa incisa TaxID=236973 RepID=A0AAN7QWQ7_9MYRT|nr:hypothetical protein SAY87_015612 [Trapa incisa]